MQVSLALNFWIDNGMLDSQGDKRRGRHAGREKGSGGHRTPGSRRKGMCTSPRVQMCLDSKGGGGS